MPGKRRTARINDYPLPLGERGHCVEMPSTALAREWKAVKVKDGGGEGEKHPFRLAVVDLGAAIAVTQRFVALLDVGDTVLCPGP